MKNYLVIGVSGSVLGTNLSYNEAIEMVKENRENGLACNAYPRG